MERDSQFSVHMNRTLDRYFLVIEDKAMWMLPHNTNNHEWNHLALGVMGNTIHVYGCEDREPTGIEGTFDECYDALRLYLLMNS